MLRYGRYVFRCPGEEGKGKADAWQFIRQLKIPYCPLYDQGYTSLGGTTDTHPNPALKAGGESAKTENKDQVFRPAYELVEDDAERLGRDWT